MKLWVVGDTAAETEHGQVWFIKGVFSSEEKALAACSEESDFIGELTLDEQLPNERMVWPGAYYPLSERSKEFCG